jgi:peptidoglycan/xylan/chitin deacetylase (PgdA/CDA1 family)
MAIHAPVFPSESHGDILSSHVDPSSAEWGVPNSNPKLWLKKTLLRSSILRTVGRFVPSTAVVLMYHSIAADEHATENILGVSRGRASFEHHMEMLARRYSPVSIEDVAQFAKSGRRLPPRAVAVTFDDGFADNYEIALPILSRYGIPATFYIMVDAVANGILPWYCRIRFAFSTTAKTQWINPETNQKYTFNTSLERKAAMTAAWECAAKMTGRVQKGFVAQIEKSLETEPVSAPHGFMLTWEQVRALRKAGHTIGAHTLSHPNLAQVSESEARSEIVGSQKTLQKEMGEPVEHFSYPHPALNPQWSNLTLDITREAGFKSAVLTTRGPVRAGDDPLALKRIGTPADLDQFTWNLDCTFLSRSS